MPRQTKYKKYNWDEKLEVIEGWARDGLTDKQIAQKMGVSESTLNQYKKKYSEFLESLKRGKEVVDREVEKSLLNNATGYYYTEQQVTNSGEVVTLEKYSKPNTTAQIFWLKNRKPDTWKDKQEIDHGIKDVTGVEIELVDDES